MASRHVLILCLLLLVGPLCGVGSGQINWGDVRPIIGSAQEGQYTLKFLNLEIENWKDNRHRDVVEQWEMDCTFSGPAATTVDPRCYLSRLRIVLPGNVTGLGADIQRLVARSADGSLRFNQINWKSGSIDFQLADEPDAQFVLTVSVRDRALMLDQFRGTLTARDYGSDHVSTIEWRVAEYDRKIDVPLVLRGMHSEADRRWDEMIRSLSAEDQRVWATIRRSPDRSRALGADDFDDSLKGLSEQELMKEDPAFAARVRANLPLLPEDEARRQAFAERISRRLNEDFGARLDAWLQRNRMSPQGRQRVAAFLQSAWNGELSASRRVSDPGRGK